MATSEYHIPVRHSIPASVALFSLFVFAVFSAPSSRAQINGAPASVTSPGFGGRSVNGPPASVTSLGPRGYAPSGGNLTFSTSTITTSTSTSAHSGDGHPHRAHGSAVYAVPVPYAVDLGGNNYDGNQNDADQNDDESDEQGGPTIFDRRGSGPGSYVPPVKNVPTPHAALQGGLQENETPAIPEPPQAQTLLIFKDGHSLEVGNYAIIGTTLFDLTPGHSRRVPLAALDLEATQKQNDDRGVTFQLPPSPQAN